MRKVDQTTFAPEGNCQSAVLAMLLDLPLESIPNFYDVGGKNPFDWWKAYFQFIEEQGFWFFAFESEHAAARAKHMKGYYEVSGPSSRGVEHAVVYKDGDLYHDPHPSREGLLSIREVRVYYPLEFSRVVT